MVDGWVGGRTGGRGWGDEGRIDVGRAVKWGDGGRARENGCAALVGRFVSRAREQVTTWNLELVSWNLELRALNLEVFFFCLCSRS